MKILYIIEVATLKSLAQVMFAGNHIEIRADNQQYWHEFLTSMSGIDPDEQPDEFFTVLSDRLDGSYIYAASYQDNIPTWKKVYIEPDDPDLSSNGQSLQYEDSDFG